MIQEVPQQSKLARMLWYEDALTLYRTISQYHALATEHAPDKDSVSQRRRSRRSLGRMSKKNPALTFSPLRDIRFSVRYQI